MPHRLITVIGPIGSGKTTVCQTLAQQFKLPTIDADLFDQNPFLPPYIQDPARWAFTVELHFTLARLKKLEPLNQLLQTSSVIVDSGLIMSQIYTKNQLTNGHLTSDEWQFYTQIVSDYQTKIPSPDLILVLQATPTTQMARIKARGRDFETGYTRKYLTQITARLEEYVTQLRHQKSNLRIVTYDTDLHHPTTQSGAKALRQLIHPHL